MNKQAAIEFLDNKNDNLLQVAINKLINDELEAATFPSKSDSFDKNFNDLVLKIETLPNNVVPYSQIAQAIYQVEKQGDENGLGLEGVIDVLKSGIIDYINNGDDTISDVSNILIKIYEHIALSDTQMNSLYSDTSSEIIEMNERLMGVQTLYGQSSENWSKIDSSITSMYSNFVSVLGIFVAISFTLFSAANLINQILTTSSNPTKIEIGSKIMLSGISVMLIYLLIVGLFQGITVVTGKSYFFSLRKLYIVCVVAGSIVLFGFVYGHDVVSWAHAWLFIGYMMIYLVVVAFGYTYGTKIKNVLIRFGKNK